MLRTFRGLPWRRRTAVVTATAGTAAGACYYYHYYLYYNAPNAKHQQRRGLQRQAYFWSRLLPVVADYYWHFGAKSPRPWLLSLLGTKDDEPPTAKQARLQALHERHAPAVLETMLHLKGLYVKLGQVLSVTALPIPQIYRQYFRTLQSDVPGYEEFDAVQKVLQQELQVDNLDSLFEWIDPIPCGAASIGQAHVARLKQHHNNKTVIVKVQYPDAAWQVLADIECVGDLLQVCIWTGVLDESAAKISFEDFARQFVSELDYRAEAINLQETHQSSVSDTATNNPYRKHGVIVPHIYPDYCTDKVITMAYLEGPKLEQEARQQLEALGIDTSKGLGTLVRAAALGEEENQNNNDNEGTTITTGSWTASLGQQIGKLMGVDAVFWTMRNTRRISRWLTCLSAQSLGLVASLLPSSWNTWREQQVTAYHQSQRIALTGQWIDALMDVHGYQIFQQGLFNADCHPGNILVVENDKLGLIDYGQCKRLSPQERARVGHLILAVAENASNEQVARAFRQLGVQTKHNNTEFLAEMARLMFGRFESQHLNHAYHKRLHQMDRMTYFPKELSMVYRTCLLLRGLAVSLQVNPSVAEHWREHAQVAVDQYRRIQEEEEKHQMNQNLPRRHVTTRILHPRANTIKATA